MVNARQDARTASVNALGLGRPVVLMMFRAEKCATTARRITNAELEDAVPRMVNVRHNVLMASVEKVVLARPTTTAEVTSAATQKVYARLTANRSRVMGSCCKRFSVVMKVIFSLGSTLTGLLLLVCCYCLYKYCSRKQHRKRTVHPANGMSTKHHSTMIINYQQRDNSDSLTIVEVMQLQRSV